MSFNILAISGSPRKKGNTELLVQAAIEPFVDNGHRVQRFFLSQKKVAPCVACEACAKDAFLSTPLLYHDRSREFCVQYLPEQVLEDVTSLQGYTTSGKANVQIPSAPPGTRSRSRRFRRPGPTPRRPGRPASTPRRTPRNPSPRRRGGPAGARGASPRRRATLPVPR